MLYIDGSTVKLGDRITFDHGVVGTVVVSVDTKEFSRSFPEAEWGYLQKGFLVATEDLGLLHVTKAPVDLARVV